MKIGIDMKTQQNKNINDQLEIIYFAGGCLWGVQEFLNHLAGVFATQAGRANGLTDTTNSRYDGYAECVKVTFDPSDVNVKDLIGYFFEIIDPYSINKQGEDVGKKYRRVKIADDATRVRSQTRDRIC